MLNTILLEQIDFIKIFKIYLMIELVCINFFANIFL
jgi:hypothetical protein